MRKRDVPDWQPVTRCGISPSPSSPTWRGRKEAGRSGAGLWRSCGDDVEAGRVRAAERKLPLCRGRAPGRPEGPRQLGVSRQQGGSRTERRQRKWQATLSACQETVLGSESASSGSPACLAKLSSMNKSPESANNERGNISCVHNKVPVRVTRERDGLE